MSWVTQFRTFLTFRAAVALAVGLFSALIWAKPTELDELSRQEIVERIMPVTSVCLQGDECAADIGSTPVASGSRSGEAIYNQFCTACHTTGLLGAPKKGDGSTWIAKQGRAGSYNQLLSNAIAGVGSMPANGTCMDCSEEEISSAIQYMSGLQP